MSAVEGLDELYAVLEVPRTADQEAIKKSYRALVLKYHPDKNPEDRETAQAKIRAINSAYETLGNIAKRNAYEAQATAIQAASARRNQVLEFSTAAHRRVDVSIPKPFLLCPMGYPDKFLRGMDRELAFHSRRDVKNVGFEEFFAGARFGMSWLPCFDNPDRLPKFNQPCMVQKLPNIVATGVGIGVETAPNCTSGWVSFGLSPGVPSSDVMVTSQAQNEVYSSVLMVPSPDFPNAFRFESHHFPGHFLAFDPPTLCQMTSVRDRFTVVDFVVVPLSQSAQYQTLDEVLIPAVLALGGDKMHVMLTEVCKDPRVRAHFQATMGSRVWDFSDFEIYFHAHWETWHYKSVTQSVRLRMKDASQDGVNGAKRDSSSVPSAEQSAKRPKPASFNRDPTSVVLLTNLVGAGEVDEDLQEETAEEAGKYGKLKSCTIREIKGLTDDEAVRIFLEFETVEAAKKAYSDMSGRYFDGRVVKARFYDEELYRAGELEKTEGI